MNKRLGCFFYSLIVLSFSYSVLSKHILNRSKRQTADQIEVSNWHLKSTVDFSVEDEKLLLYTQITFGSTAPILNVHVTATLTPENSESITIDLIDNGLDRVDNTKDDGIYSGFLDFCLTPGRYSVAFDIKSTPSSCRVVRRDLCENITAFERRDEGEMITITNCGTRGQLQGPGVGDLSITFNKTTSEITAKWTEGWANDTIVAYNLYFVQSFVQTNVAKDWITHGRILKNLFPALPIGSPRTANANLSQENGEIRAAIVAESLVTRGMSNFVTVYINDVTVSTPATTQTTKEATQTTVEQTSDKSTTAAYTEKSTTAEVIFVNTTTSTSTTTTSAPNESGLSGWVVAAIVVSSIVAGGVIVACLFIKFGKIRHARFI